MLTLNLQAVFRAKFTFFPIFRNRGKVARKYAILRASKIIKVPDF